MLKVFLGDMPDAIYAPPIYFDAMYEDEWLIDELSKEMILDVDKSIVVGPHMIESPVLGPIPPSDLSGGVKTLILIAFDDTKIFNASACGDNCAKWLLEIGKRKDIIINLRHLMIFKEEPFTIQIMNDDSTVHTREEFLFKVHEFIY